MGTTHDGPGISDEERIRRQNDKKQFRRIVDEEELEGRGRTFTWDMRRAEVEAHTPESAAKQYRLRQMSDNNIYRTRNFVSNVDTQEEEHPLATNSDTATTLQHIVEMMAMQNFEGAYFHSLSKESKLSVKDYFSTIIPGKYNININE